MKDRSTPLDCGLLPHRDKAGPIRRRGPWFARPVPASLEARERSYWQVVGTTDTAEREADKPGSGLLSRRLARGSATPRARQPAGRGGRTRSAGGGVPRFREAAERVVALHAKSWKQGAGTAAKWHQTFRDYVFPVIGDKRVGAITTADVMAVLTPIWTEKPSRRVRCASGSGP